ncbi:MAG TPA: DNA-processing protein DprA [Chloroflexota bacterium]|nr:DNA-processing protein DprA [Chloroflexota bacterium]
MPDEKYWLGFNLVNGVGPAKVQALLDYFGSLAAAWQATELQLAQIGFDRRTIKNLQETRTAVDLDRAWEQVRAAGIHLLTWDSPDYPAYLKEIPTPPPLLYVQGELQEADQWAVAVVGTRRLTSYGRQVTQDLVAGLVRHNITIVSGLARGIDAVAHKTAVEMGGRTIAVLGSGLDAIYPTEHRQLAHSIAQGHGALVSEYGLGVQPEAKNFPPRNRIISGLSLGILVVEAAERSGALITANFAAEQNRDVFAVPGNINSPASKGPNQLIQQGARLVMGVEDILEELNIHMVAEHTAVQMALPETAEEIALYTHLSSQPVHIDDLSRASGLPTGMVSSTLTIMELKGMVRQVGGMNYILCREPDPAYEVAEIKNKEIERLGE